MSAACGSGATGGSPRCCGDSSRYSAAWTRANTCLERWRSSAGMRSATTARSMGMCRYREASGTSLTGSSGTGTGTGVGGGPWGEGVLDAVEPGCQFGEVPRQDGGHGVVGDPGEALAAVDLGAVV